MNSEKRSFSTRNKNMDPPFIKECSVLSKCKTRDIYWKWFLSQVAPYIGIWVLIRGKNNTGVFVLTRVEWGRGMFERDSRELDLIEL